MVLERYRSLSRPAIDEGTNVFRVVPVPGWAAHRLGRDSAGAPVLLLQVRAEGSSPAPLVLQHLVVQHDVRCRMVSSADGRVREEVVSLVRCTSPETTLREYFVDVAGLTVHMLGVSPTRQEVSRAIKRLTELFRAFEQPQRKSVQGLWAELFLIASSENPELLVVAWHVDPDEAFDFGSGPQRIEVKSYAGEPRVHSFSVRQVRPGPGVEALVASLHAERSSGGLTIADLVRQVAERGVSAPADEKLRNVVARSLGEAAASGLALGFDAERAASSLRFFDSRQIPAVEPPFPRGVLSVRFEALLDDARRLPVSEQRGMGGLFEAALPRPIGP